MKILLPDEPFQPDRPTALALGCFDGVHIGHAAVIRAAIETGQMSAVVTFRQPPAALLKSDGAQTLMTDALREKVLDEMGLDALIYLDFPSVRNLSPEAFIRDILMEKFRAAAVFCGFNYRFGKGAAAGPQELMEICARLGIRGVRIDPVCVGGRPVSSTRIRALVTQGKMEQVAQMLGRPFSLCLPVIHGHMLGRRLGAPTINQRIPAGHIVPRFGVYASAVEAGGQKWPAVTNVGVRPTVSPDGILVESYILGYDGDLYGQEIPVEFIRFLRPERKFENTVQLKAQIRQDAQQAAGLTRAAVVR